MIAAVRRARRLVSQIVAWRFTLFAWTCCWCAYVHLIVRSRKAATTASSTMVHSKRLAAAGTYFHFWPEVVVSKPPEKCCSKEILERMVANPHARQEKAIAIEHGSLDQTRTLAPLPWLMAKGSRHELKKIRALEVWTIVPSSDLRARSFPAMRTSSSDKESQWAHSTATEQSEMDTPVAWPPVPSRTPIPTFAFEISRSLALSFFVWNVVSPVPTCSTLTASSSGSSMPWNPFNRIPVSVYEMCMFLAMRCFADNSAPTPEFEIWTLSSFTSDALPCK